MSLDEAIKAAEEAARKLREALDVLELEAVVELGAPHDAAWLKKQAATIRFCDMRRAQANAKRPKGPMVTVEWSEGGTQPRIQEVIRRTATQAVLKHPEYLSTESYRLDDGTPAGRGVNRYLGYWRIRGADLEIVRAMPVGENAVSRALKAIEAGRYEVKA